MLPTTVRSQDKLSAPHDLFRTKNGLFLTKKPRRKPSLHEHFGRGYRTPAMRPGWHRLLKPLLFYLTTRPASKPLLCVIPGCLSVLALAGQVRKALFLLQDRSRASRLPPAAKPRPRLARPSHLRAAMLARQEPRQPLILWSTTPCDKDIGTGLTDCEQCRLSRQPAGDQTWR